MPSWKKVIISGSNAALNSLTVTNGITGSLFGTASFATTSSFLGSTTNAFIQNGNSFGTTALLGTNDNQSLALETSGSTRMFISSSGNIGINTTASTVALQIGDTTSGAGNYIKVLGNNSDSTYDVFVGARRYPRFTLEDTTVGGSAFQMWSLGNTMRFGTNTGTAETSAWYTKAGNAADVIFNGNVGIAKTTPNAKLDVSGSAIVSGSFTVIPGTIREFQVRTTGVDIGNLITDTHTVTGSLNISGSITGSLFGTASFASTASFVNTLNQNVLITGSAVIGSSSLGSSENTLTLGPSLAGGAGEGGQLGFNAQGGTYTSASFIDNYQNQIRILKGTNAGSNALVAQWDLHTNQMKLPSYTNASAFVGTATANLAVDSGGNIITVSTSGTPVFPYTGNAVITGSLTVTQPIYVPINGNMYFQGGDDAALYDVNIVNTMGIYGVQDVTVGAIKLGSNGPVLYGSGSSLGIGTIQPLYPLHVSASASGTSIYATGDIVAFSDQSVKENIRPIENVLERIGDSRGVLYDRIDNGEKDNIGFIAQELEVAFPELVVTNPDGTKAVKYQNAVAILFEAIKEQQKQINGILKLLNK